MTFEQVIEMMKGEYPTRISDKPKLKSGVKEVEEDVN
jgi:hypothetical protein